MQSEKWGASERLERDNAGLWSWLEREIGVSGADLYRTCLAGTLAGCNPAGHWQH